MPKIAGRIVRNRDILEAGRVSFYGPIPRAGRDYGYIVIGYYSTIFEKKKLLLYYFFFGQKKFKKRSKKQRKCPP